MLTTSRKDDFVSLCYLLTYLMDFNLHFLKDTFDNHEVQPSSSCKLGFLKILNKKENLKPDELCATENSWKIIDFVSEVFDLKFDDKPNYSRLKFLLVKELLDYD